MLRDLNQELLSRFADELCLNDTFAKTLGSPCVTTRASLGACIGEGNKNFFKYSIFGRIYIILQVLIEEAQWFEIASPSVTTSSSIETVLKGKAIYNKLKLFPSEISAAKLANTATTCIKKFHNDYRIGSFLHLIEWRCSIDTFANCNIEQPKPDDYVIIINNENVFQPSLVLSMRENSEVLSKHLHSLLRLDTDDMTVDEIDETITSTETMSNNEILYYATQHDLPIFVSMDGGLENGIATISITIVAPHILDTDEDDEWQNRPAKALLIRSWRLPREWGSNETCINMAE
jgi:hypothetical protein